MEQCIKMNFGKIDNILLFGGGPLLYQVCVWLYEKNKKITVITSERHAREIVTKDGKQFYDALFAKGIAVQISQDINTDQLIHKMVNGGTLGLSIGAAWIFKKNFIDLFNGRLINSHGTRLPQNRGGGGFSWQILRKNHLGFALLHQIDGGIDTGNIVLEKEFFYPATCRIPVDYEIIYQEETLALIQDLFQKIESGQTFNLLNQQEIFSSYWPRLSTGIHGFIDWRWNLSDIEQFICAFDKPYSGALTFINGNKVHLRNCLVDINDGVFHPFQCGLVYRKTKNALYVATEDGTLIVQELNSEDGENLLPTINIGDRFFTPQENLESAKAYRAIYTPKGLKE